MSDIERVIALEPDREDANRRGLVLSYLGRYEEAIDAYDQYLCQYPEHFYALYNIAVATVRWKGLNLGQPAIERALKALDSVDDSGKGSALYGFGGLAALRGDDEHALDYLRQAIPIEPLAIRWARHNMAWLDLREDPRFQELLASRSVQDGGRK